MTLPTDPTTSDTTAPGRIALKHGAHRLEPRRDEAMARWRGHRFGQFIHFGLYSLAAGSWQGTSHDFAAEFLPRVAQVPEPEWAALADQFSLPNFDAQVWAEHAVQAGARYVTITTKHHEGFCLWPSELTNLHIGNTPFGRDLLGELVAAYTARGIDVQFYYSVLDWHHPDWRYREDSDPDREAGIRFREFVLGQLGELCQRYPQVTGFWFDGTWDESIKRHGEWTDQVERQLKSWVPGVLVNSRLRADELGHRHLDANGDLMGDYESGYERRLPEPWNQVVLDRDWEACLTIPEHSWGYHAGEWASRSRRDWRDLVDQLGHAVSRGGNVLLNVSPRGDGSHDPADVEVTARVGDWLARHESAIRGAGAERRLDPPGWGWFTRGADGRTHALITRMPSSGRVRIDLAGQGELADLRWADPVAAEPVPVAPGVVELRFAELPRHPVSCSFLIAEPADEGFTEPNPDAG